MKLRCLTALVGIFLAVHNVPSQERLNGADPFYLEKGSSFSASTTSPQSKRPIAKRTESETIVDDVEEALTIIRGNYTDRDVALSDKAMNSAVRSMLKALDPHSNFYDPTEFADLLGEHRSEYSGSGSTIMNFSRDGQVETYVVAVTPGSPASEAGVGFGDRIVAVDGTNVSGLSSLAVREMVRGPKGTYVKIAVEHAANKSVETIRIRRERLPQPTIPNAFVIADGVGYIDMTVGFSYTTVTELETALAGLKGKGITSLVIDLRGNGGGIVDQAVAVAEKFLPQGRSIVSQRGRNPHEDRSWRSTNSQPEMLPLVLLVDENTASAAEIVAGAFQDNDRALIVGSRTFGKGLVQNVLELDGGGGLTLTAARYYTPSGRSIQRDYADGSLYEYFANTERPAAIDRSAFVARTLTDRKVFGGNGIAPDIEIPKETFDPKLSKVIDNVFFFANELLTGRIAGTPTRQEIRRSIMFGEDPVSESVVSTFGAIYALDASSESDLAVFIRSQMRYFISLGAFGVNEANKARVQDDLYVLKAIENIPASARLSRKAESVKR